MSFAVRSVIPIPPAEFSPLTTIRSGSWRSRSEGIVSRSPRRPGPPTTSPMKRSRMAPTLAACFRASLPAYGGKARKQCGRVRRWPARPTSRSWCGGRSPIRMTRPPGPSSSSATGPCGCRRRRSTRRGRRALLAYGANASPEALTRKLAGAAAPTDPRPAHRAQRLGRRLLGPRHPLRRGPGRGRPQPRHRRERPPRLPRATSSWRRSRRPRAPNYGLERLADFSAEYEIGGEGRRPRSTPSSASTARCSRRRAGRPRRDPRPRPRLPRADDAGDDRPRPRRPPSRDDPRASSSSTT